MSMLQATATGASESPLSDMGVLPELNEKARNLSMDYPWIMPVTKTLSGLDNDKVIIHGYG